MIDLKEREAVTTIIRHECGHLVVARSLGFPSGGIHLSPTEASASIDLLLSLKTINEAPPPGEGWAGILKGDQHNDRDPAL
jgi:hypothetical protein